VLSHLRSAWLPAICILAVLLLSSHALGQNGSPVSFKKQKVAYGSHELHKLDIHQPAAVIDASDRSHSQINERFG